MTKDYGSWLYHWQNSTPGDNPTGNLRPRGYDYDAMARYLVDLLKIKNTTELIDIGCGNGLLLKALNSYTHLISGVDYADNMVRATQELLANTDWQIQGWFRTAPAHQLPFGDDNWDIVLCLGVLQYYDDVAQAREAVTEMARICRPGGKIYLGDLPDHRYLDSSEGMLTFVPGELITSLNFKFKILKSRYEPERRFDLIIYKPHD